MTHSIRAALLDRDPGDESDHTTRSYRATLKKRGEDGLDSIVFRDIEATTFADAVWTAEHQREENELLLNVRAIEDLDHISLAHR